MNIEHASIEHAANRGIEAMLRRAPPWVRSRVNAARQRSGLVPLDRHHEDDPGRVRAWWDPDSPHRPRGGSLLINPPTGGKAASPRSAGGGLVDRVLMVVAHGDATAASIGKALPETIARGAFGPAEQLNRERGWGLTIGHDSPLIAFGGPAGEGRLQAHDADDVGLVLAWEPDMARRDHKEAVRLIEAGAGASVLMSVLSRSTLRAGNPITVVSRARLLNVAIVDRPAYRGSVAKVFRGSRRNDSCQLREQLAAVAREARRKAVRLW